MTSENRELCMDFFARCKEAGKVLSAFPDVLTMLSSEVSTNGLSEKELHLLVTIITKLTISSNQRSSLIKCLIPVRKMSEKTVEDVGLWLISTMKNIHITPAVAVIQWLIGLLNYGLIDRKVVNTFYDAFFFILVKNQKLEPYIAQLIYILTKPEDVSRRQVSRILTLQSQYAKPKKHLTALLCLFKSYKPEHVPEKIQSINIESAWKRIPEALRLDLQEAAKRCNGDQFVTNWQSNLVWNPITEIKTSSKRRKTLIPTVGYINIGSSISKEKDTKSIFEIRTLDELGKHQLCLELPCNAVSLLANNAGLHILTYSSSDYQSRFCYNLYNMLQNAFIYEVGKYSYQECDILLQMTVELSRYMQQEVILVSKFLQYYLPLWNTRDHRESILALIEWMTVSSCADIHNNILVPLQIMWESSSVDIKCEILKTFTSMITNLFIKQDFKEPALFLGDSQTLELGETIEFLTEFVKELVVSGLYIESNNGILLSEALTFYEQIAALEERSNLVLWTIAPPAVIYGGFISQSVAILSRICALLLRYRKINAKLRELQCRNLFESKIKSIDTYAKNLAAGLWFNELFTNPTDRYFLQSIPNSILTDLRCSCNLDLALNISNHYAVLPYKYTLLGLGLEIQTAEDCLSVAETYYPQVAEFLRIFSE